MNTKARAMVGVIVWSASITALHWRLNVDWSSFFNDRLPERERKLTVAYVPVT